MKRPYIQSLDWREIDSGLLPDSREYLSHYELLPVVDSTNSRAMSACQNFANLPMVCLAEQQLSGRGRHGRQWVSPRGQNIYMSLVSILQLPLIRLSGLSIAIGVELVKLLRKYGVAAVLKWPNDVQVNGQKLAGILVETRIKPESQVCVVIGMGLNYEMQDMDATEIDQDWVDLSRILANDQLPGRNQLVADLINGLVGVLSVFPESGLNNWMSEWAQFDVCSGQELEVIEGDRRYKGVGAGINDSGALQVKVGEDMKVVHSSDVSIRLIR